MGLINTTKSLIRRLVPEKIWKRAWREYRYIRADRFARRADPGTPAAIGRRSVFRNITENHVLIDDRLRYGQLERYIDTLPTESAIQTMENLFAINCERLKEKSVIRVAFVVYSSSEWQCEELYRMMEQDERFDPRIVICGYVHGNEHSIRRAYDHTAAFFREQGDYRIETLGCQTTETVDLHLDEYDILFYFIPGEGMLPVGADPANRKISQLMCYVPYGIAPVPLSEFWHKTTYDELLVLKLCWYHFCSNPAEEKEKHKGRLHGYNVILSGLMKSDALIDHTYPLRSDLWKSGPETIRRIIWAPHYNVAANSTFHENYRFFYQFAKEHPEISWIVRPHPRLEWAVQNYHIMTEEEYLHYLEEWNDLPNARVIPDGGYYDAFDSSDGLILDSLSFLVEYQHTGKPLLFLISKHPMRMNELGDAILENAYTAQGDDTAKITRFITELAANDPKRTAREKMYREMVDCRQFTGTSASAFVFRTIKEKVSQQMA